MDYAVGIDGEEDRLRDAEALLRMAARLGRLGAWSIDLQQQRVTWSDEVCAIHDVPPRSGCGIEEGIRYYVPEDRPVIRAAFEACVREGRPWDLELRMLTATGRRIWVRTIGQPEYGPGGRVERVRGAFQDITRQKEAAESEHLLAERLSMTLESLTEPFITLDRAWRITFLNGQAECLLRCRREDVLGRNVWEAFPEAAGTVFQQEYERALATGTMADFEAYYPPLGAWGQVRAYPSSLGLAISIRDITARRHAQEEVLRLNHELEERVRSRTAELECANRTLQAFTHTVAHDLRAPLAAINGFAQALDECDGGRLSPRGRQLLDRVRGAGAQLEDMTQGLLALCGLSASDLRQEDVDLAAMAGEEIAQLREQQPGRAVEFVAPARLPARADPALARQVVRNLLDNAWKFTGRTPQARIEVGVQQDERGGEVFFVADNGAGFEPEYAQRLFQPFSRLHDAGEFPGTGLGLAGVHRIVRRHGGRIWAEGHPGRGAVFRFTFGSSPPGGA